MRDKFYSSNRFYSPSQYGLLGKYSKWYSSSSSILEKLADDSLKALRIERNKRKEDEKRNNKSRRRKECHLKISKINKNIKEIG
ncbi:MAG: hypothetical protein WC554_17620 [Clostridia bacterium]